MTLINGEEIVLEAAKLATDPVLKALSKIGFKEKGSRGNVRKLRFVSPGPGFTMDSFIQTLNYVLSKDKRPGDQLFNPPWFNGFYICSSALYHEVKYEMEIGVGTLLLSIMYPVKKHKAL